MTSYKTYRLRLLPVLGAVFGSIGFLAACSSDPTLYTLAALPGAAQGSTQGPIPGSVSGLVPGGAIAGTAPTVVEVRTPSVSTRLDRDTIVRANENYRTTLAHGTSWSEALPDMVGHTLAADLTQRLPGTMVFSEGDAVSAKASAYVELTLRNFEADAGGYATVTGLLSVHTPGHTAGHTAEATADSSLTTPVVWRSSRPVGHDVSALVAALSHGVAAIADQAADRLRALPPPGNLNGTGE